MLHQTIIAAVLAGNEILEVYNSAFSVEYKEDKSPVTLADKKASDKIIELLACYNIPVMSEEDVHEDFTVRKNWTTCWIVDPLDGTKEFVKRNGEFTVNIALVENGEPILGVIYSPVSKDIYFAQKNVGAFKIEATIFTPFISTIETSNFNSLLSSAIKLPVLYKKTNYVVVASRSHLSKETNEYLHQLKTNIHPRAIDMINTGSSIKMCLVAEGIADEYPRFGSTMEWDTAAGQAILQEAGCELIDLKTNLPMVYNREQLLNNSFIARRKLTAH